MKKNCVRCYVVKKIGRGVAGVMGTMLAIGIPGLLLVWLFDWIMKNYEITMIIFICSLWWLFLVAIITGAARDFRKLLAEARRECGE